MYQFVISLQGAAEKDRTTLRYDLPASITDEAAAMTAASTIHGALIPLTDANVSQQALINVFDTDGQRAPDGSDCYEEAAISVYLNPDTDAIKLHTLRIPAPIDSLFQLDGSTVDTANPDLIMYIAVLATNATVSDNETIKTTSTHGIAGGYKRTKAKRFK